jgi:hypothetical protein
MEILGNEGKTVMLVAVDVQVAGLVAVVGLLSPILASLAMAIRSIIVVGNSLRLRRIVAKRLFLKI